MLSVQPLAHHALTQHGNAPRTTANLSTCITAQHAPPFTAALIKIIVLTETKLHSLIFNFERKNWIKILRHNLRLNLTLALLLASPISPLRSFPFQHLFLRLSRLALSITQAVDISDDAST